MTRLVSDGKSSGRDMSVWLTTGLSGSHSLSLLCSIISRSGFQTSRNEPDVSTLVGRCGGWLKGDVVYKCNVDDAVRVSKHVGPTDVKGK